MNKLEESVVRIPKSMVRKPPEQPDRTEVRQTIGDTRTRLFATPARFRPRALNRIFLRELRPPE